MRLFIDAIRLGMVGELFQQLEFFKPHIPSIPTFCEEVFLPGQNSELHNGFVNCHSNQNGLQAKFFRTERGGVGMRWEKSMADYEGYPGLIHGGITASLLDELMTNTVFHAHGKFGVTFKAKFKWVKPLHTGVPVTGFGVVTSSSAEFARVRAYIFRPDKKLIATSEGLFFFPTASQFKKMIDKVDFPEHLEPFFRSNRKLEKKGSN